MKELHHQDLHAVTSATGKSRLVFGSPADAKARAEQLSRLEDGSLVQTWQVSDVYHILHDLDPGPAERRRAINTVTILGQVAKASPLTVYRAPGDARPVESDASRDVAEAGLRIDAGMIIHKLKNGLSPATLSQRQINTLVDAWALMIRDMGRLHDLELMQDA
ncbi:hypothetical protein HOU02_gp247 [Caulobacter phage CcrBL9]|uniref:Uncharacterized protein n=1 Tax=Caulobacter phage CcrBL9 TaxID=2283270 RepID=A0A385EFD3_9CAUD|nr:hypothetical protein HOU02_gp247 [Caulobacter phage CcrBL9]AXQ69478.1 hypothetical protein CcrBL9_gp454 [Caulobacter phage CcrBL9]